MVRVYDDIFTEQMGKSLINLFESSYTGHEFLNRNHKPCFTQLNLNQYHPGVVKSLIQWTRNSYYEYVVDIRSKHIPDFKHLEEFRIKRYNTGKEERFDEHVDVTDYASARRTLAFLFYLNDNDGNTFFPEHNITIQPKAGRVLVFPPTWEYPHCGIAPYIDKKYIMSTYLHYG